MSTAQTATLKLYQPNPRETILAACLWATVRDEVHWTHKYRHRKGWCRAGFIDSGDGFALLHHREGRKQIEIVEYSADDFDEGFTYISQDRWSSSCHAYGAMLDEWKAIRRSCRDGVIAILKTVEYRKSRRSILAAYAETIPSKGRRIALADDLLRRAAGRRLTGKQFGAFLARELPNIEHRCTGNV